MPAPAPPPAPNATAPGSENDATWDIFCNVVDNHGDLGVCWRLSAQLAAQGQRVRLWVDEPDALEWMAPSALSGAWPGITVQRWQGTPPSNLPPGDVLIEAFGCDIPPAWVLAVAPRPGPWINLEYLSAETYVERMHGLPSPVMSGPLAGRTKRFFYPGFTLATGGLLREPDLLARQAGFERNTWLQQHAAGWRGETVVSLFCYEPAQLGAWLDHLRQPDQPPTRLLVAPGRPAAAVQRHLGEAAHHGPLHIEWRPYCCQHEFDHMLWASNLNMVRGEDSLVRALWAGNAFVWHIYPQDDLAHHAKLDAFLGWLQAPPSLSQLHRLWNSVEPGALPALDPSTLSVWRDCAQTARGQLLAQQDLLAQLRGLRWP